MAVMGGVSIAANTSGQTTSGTPNTPTNITAGALTKAALVSNGITVDAANLELTIQYAAVYACFLIGTVTGDAAVYTVVLDQNGSVVAGAPATLAGSDHQCLPTIQPVVCEVGDVLKPRISCASASKSVTVTDLTLFALRQGTV